MLVRLLEINIGCKVTEWFYWNTFESIDMKASSRWAPILSRKANIDPENTPKQSLEEEDNKLRIVSEKRFIANNSDSKFQH